ncbi:hypothetical protein DSLASN_04380 [Desulfoluna limicola]|uniref:Jacalin-type lectin domain-containing protein n=1 Tax=Desulfoluna limicola TaxID=2810562 RepID=A0ABM7PC71_9BACT|nr:hypothetical protein [Desulfoluna limicola]BCS94806.1 hypothetical protein DSLASN_04380 [Desulfoluna limicola]
MSLLTGKFMCKELNAELIISHAEDSDGSAIGEFVLAEKNIPVSIHYHFKNSGGPETTLTFSGHIDDPNYYAGGSGYIANIKENNEIDIAGGFTSISDTTGFSGKFFKV